jgi:hypothetical protein
MPAAAQSLRLFVWNMGNGGPANSDAKHEEAWRYLSKQDWDVALLQETRTPPEWARSEWGSIVWRPKYACIRSGKTLWGCAVIARSLDLQPYDPDSRFPWLRKLAGSTAIARSQTEPTWFASVHLHASAVPKESRRSPPRWPRR